MGGAATEMFDKELSPDPEAVELSCGDMRLLSKTGSENGKRENKFCL